MAFLVIQTFSISPPTDILPIVYCDGQYDDDDDDDNDDNLYIIGAVCVFVTKKVTSSWIVDDDELYATAQIEVSTLDSLHQYLQLARNSNGIAPAMTIMVLVLIIS